MADFRTKLRRNRVWSIAVYVEPADFSFDSKLSSPSYVLNARKLRNSNKHVHTYADPFLFPQGDELFLFYESQAVGEPGKIEVARTSDLERFEPMGVVLKEPSHLSFPFVFEYKANIYLLPESASSGEVALYRFIDFPTKVVKDRVLLTGSYKDSSLIEHDGIWYFFTTSASGLELYYTDDLEHGHFIPHKLNPLSKDRRYNQCGGSPIRSNGSLYRVAQDCSQEYGRNISILKILELSRTDYREQVIFDDYFDLTDDWNSRGGHHLSMVQFGGNTVIAVDGKQDDLWVNKLLSLIY